jgi:RNA polymerase sigma-70 factor (ECF subfamily)
MPTNPPAPGLRTTSENRYDPDLKGRGPSSREGRPVRPFRKPASSDRPHGGAPGLDALLERVARGEEAAFEQTYDQVAGAVYGLVRRVVRDPAQSEEVVQGVLVEVWRTASRYEPAKGSALAWIMTMAHRRAVDRVRSEQAASDRQARVAHREQVVVYDEVAEDVEARLDRERVRRCLDTLTDLQRQSVALAYYEGYTYREVAELLTVPLGTVKTRMRDGMIRLRDCLGVES